MRPGKGPLPDSGVIDAFLAASRNGDFDALLVVLDPDVVLRADGAAAWPRGHRRKSAARRPCPTHSKRAPGPAQPALMNGGAGLVWAPGGQLRVVFGFTIARGKIAAINLIARPGRLRQLDLVVLND